MASLHLACLVLKLRVRGIMAQKMSGITVGTDPKEHVIILTECGYSFTCWWSEIVGNDAGSIRDTTSQLITKCDTDISNDWYRNAVHGHMEHIMKILVEHGYFFTARVERETVRDLAKQLSYIALDFDTEMMESSDKVSVYELPDGNIISADGEFSRGADVFPQPCFEGKEASCIHDTMLRSIMKCDSDIGNDCFGNAVRGHMEYMMKILTERGYSFITFAERDTVRDLVKQPSYIALDVDAENIEISDNDKVYVRLDGNVICAGGERSSRLEVLFQLHFVGKEASGIGQWGP